MSGIDHKIEALHGENARETHCATESACAQPARKGHGLRSSPRERQGDIVTRVTFKRAGEVGGLAAAAENEKLHRFHHAEVAL
jgi:hypothetical protein